jgi:hypothetical protein
VWAEFDIGGGAAVTDTRSSRRVVRH